MGLATRLRIHRLHHLHHQHDQQAQVAKMAEARMEACLAWLQSWLAWLACWEASLVAEDWSECLKKAMEPLAQPLLAESPVTESPLPSVLGSPLISPVTESPLPLPLLL